jgi:UDP-glucose 4-epimerase
VPEVEWNIGWYNCDVSGEFRLAILVTGGAGFIGSNFILDWLRLDPGPAVNFDKPTYAGNPQHLASIADHPDYFSVRADICDRDAVHAALAEHHLTAVINFAAVSLLIAIYLKLGYFRVDLSILFPFVMIVSIAGVMLVRPKKDYGTGDEQSWLSSFRESLPLNVGKSFAVTKTEIFVVLLWVRVVRIAVAIIVATPSAIVLGRKLRRVRGAV